MRSSAARPPRTSTGNYVLRFGQAINATAPQTDIPDTAGNPLALRVRATLAWTRHGPQRPGPLPQLAVNYAGG